ncbi:MAG: PilN domain-containing protein [Deltaproteobacteria bacterium]|nr:PilN domain-containing protein [Deltaproteobacteria bacterium]
MKFQIAEFVKEVLVRKSSGTIETTRRIVAALEPTTIWLERVSVGPQEVIISGFAHKAQEIPTYIKNLKRNEDLFKQVTLVSIKQAASKDGKIHGLLIKCERRGPSR